MAAEYGAAFAKTEVALNGEKAPGNRTEETNLGDLCADAYRDQSGADVALVNGGGIFPARIENYPEQLACLNRGMINVQLMGAQGALNCDRRAIFHAIAADPNTQSKLGLDEIQAMTDELFEALRSEMSPVCRLKKMADGRYIMKRYH